MQVLGSVGLGSDSALPVPSWAVVGKCLSGLSFLFYDMGLWVCVSVAEDERAWPCLSFPHRVVELRGQMPELLLMFAPPPQTNVFILESESTDTMMQRVPMCPLPAAPVDIHVFLAVHCEPDTLLFMASKTTVPPDATGSSNVQDTSRISFGHRVPQPLWSVAASQTGLGLMTLPVAGKNGSVFCTMSLHES